MTTLADTIAATLAEHEERQRLVEHRWVLVCSCREWGTDREFDERAEEQHDLHRAHVATVLAEQEAQRRKAERVARGGAL